MWLSSHYSAVGPLLTAAYFNAISLSKKHEANIRDILRLLSLWFTYGASPELLDSVQNGLNTVSVDTWLQVRVDLLCIVLSTSININVVHIVSFSLEY